MQIARVVFFCLFLFNYLSGHSQSPDIFNIPASVPRPCWVDRINWNRPNVHQIDSVIRQCRRLSGFQSEEDEFNQKPYRIALRRWLRQPDVFIKGNGDVVTDREEAYRNMKSAVDRQALFNLPQMNRSITSASWTLLGPVTTYNNGSVKNWQVNIYSLAIAPSDPNILFAGSETGVIFRSADKGLNWVSVNDALLNNSVKSISVHPADPNIVYAYSGGLLKSVNGGASWSLLSAFGGGVTNRILINPSNGRVITASENGIYYSDNAGVNWTRATMDVSPGTQIYDIAIRPSDPTVVYAVAASSSAGNPMIMYQSSNSGNSFSSRTLPANTFCKGARLAVSPANNNYVYCVTLQDDVPKLLLSTDAGSTWSLRVTFTGTGLTGSNSVNGMSNGQGYYDLGIFVSPANINHVITGTTTAYKSTDGGLNFSPLGGYHGSFTIHPDVQWMTAQGNDAYITTDGGIMYSSDFFTSTSNAQARISGLSGSDYWGFGQGWSEDIVVGGRYHNGNAALFDEYGTGNSYQLGGAESPTGHVFQIPGYERITGFNDLGSTLKILPSTLSGSVTNAPFNNTKWPGDDYYGLFSSKLMQDPRYAHIFYVGRDSALWKSENYGQSYQVLKHFGTTIWRYDISRSNPDVIYVCTRTGIQKTTNGGATWTALSMPSGVTWSFYNTDIAVNPGNENEVWFCMANGASANKVFKSVNGGASWTNYTGTSLNAKAVAFIVSQGGTNGGVYAILNSRPAKVYYRDASMADWLDFSNGLPMNFNARQGGLIFYRDRKLRLTGNRGTWESPLYISGEPLAMPMADKKNVSCTKDTIVFSDHSILEYEGASWSWQFPGASYVSSTTARVVKVLYPGPASYRVTLTVTDALGRSSSRTISNMITFTRNNCDVDTVAGRCLSLTGNSPQYNIGTANINSNNFSISCWIKPSGNQKSFSQLVSHDPYPGSSYGFGLGFSFSGYTPNLKLCYTDNVVGYGNSSTQIADSTAWNFVVLTYSPTGVRIYLNGVAATVNNSVMAAIDLSKSPFYINRDIHNQGGDYKGLIDEVKIYNYALSQNEVREKMHLINSNGIAETGLLKYVQFNLLDSATNCVYELVNGKQVSMPSTNVLVTSRAPVGTGSSFRKASVNTGGQHSFPGTGVDLFWPSTGTFPNGELVAFRLNSLPGPLPNSGTSIPVDKYFIINNYGTNKIFTPLQKIVLAGLPLLHGGFALSDLTLFKRPSNSIDSIAWSNTGNASLIQYQPGNNSTVEFSGSNINGFSQFVINSRRGATSLVNLKAFIQGMQTGSNLMRPALYNSGVPGSVQDMADSITVELRSGSTGVLTGGPVKAILKTDGNAIAAFPALTGDHYLVLKHRNALETWSAQPITLGESVNYDFTVAANRAFGSNLANSNGIFSLWSGDLNQDGAIESSDYSKMENDVISILFGYWPADISGDGIVESDDYSLIENNILRIIFVARPF